MNEFKASDFPEVYKDLAIETYNLGCIMLDLEPLPDLTDYFDPEDLYYAKDPKYKYIKGLVSAETPHATLLYGLLPGVKKWHVDSVLEDWWAPSVQIEEISYFESNYVGEEYYCVVAKLDPSYGLEYGESLIEAHQRLTLLPHIQTFPEYKAHLTIAYIKRDRALLDTVVDNLHERLYGLEVASQSINYGGKIT